MDRTSPRDSFHDVVLGIVLLVIAAMVLASVGCFPPPGRPVYAPDTCVPSADDYAELARDTRDHPRLVEISADPAVALGQALDEVRRLDLELRRKPTTSTELDGFSTTLPGVIWLAADWDEKPLAEQSWLLWHEIVHAKQWRRLGLKRFLMLYAVPEGRWALEVAAYRFSFLLQLHHGEDPELVRDRVQEKARRLHGEYRLGDMPACASEGAAAIWLEAA